MIAPGIDGYDPNLSRDSVTHDIEGAKKLLKDNGWNEKNLPTIEYGGVSGVRQKQFYEQFRGWVRKIGYPTNKVRFKTFSTCARRDRFKRSEHLRPGREVVWWN